MHVRKSILFAAFALALAPGAALAHGDISSSTPPADKKLKKPPGHLIINFTETPTKSSVVQVRDGCGDEITTNLDFADQTAHVFVKKGQPGSWKVSYKVLSADDGHKTSGGYGFTVDGKTDCSKDDGNSGKGQGGDGGKDDPVEGDAAPPGQAGDPGDEEDSFPVVPIALGSAGVIGLALVARRLAG